jgi:hypothetical protein
VITAGELAQLLRLRGINFVALPDACYGPRCRRRPSLCGSRLRTGSAA